eukprot:TRINITY_DN85345_c0_g1_i1.p1 TRINITY_DN85345_c0_g1~~TRINITY_DN85345_c0_g1_i1.p1  ORF type:complete len:237 (+),score=14.64 TRINITY_DN85345_c0_g1_i1:39-749(+)
MVGWELRNVPAAGSTTKHLWDSPMSNTYSAPYSPPKEKKKMLFTVLNRKELEPAPPKGHNKEKITFPKADGSRKTGLRCNIYHAFTEACGCQFCKSQEDNIDIPTQYKRYAGGRIFTVGIARDPNRAAKSRAPRITSARARLQGHQAAQGSVCGWARPNSAREKPQPEVSAHVPHPPKRNSKASETSSQSVRSNSYDHVGQFMDTVTRTRAGGVKPRQGGATYSMLSPGSPNFGDF